MAPWEIFAPDQLATILGARTCQHMLNGFGYFTWADQEGLDVQETCFFAFVAFVFVQRKRDRFAFG